jgi:MFS family permease
MGDLVKVSRRGTYFGHRNRIMTIGTFLTMTGAGFLLRHFKDASQEVVGFAVVFSLAFLSRIASLYFLSIKYDPPAPRLVGPEKGFLEFVKNLPRQNQGLLILYMSLVNFAVFTGAAYFTPLMLREYKFNYATYTFVVVGTAVTKFLTYSLWGQFCDNWGPRKILRVSGFLICFTTLPWLFTANPVWLFLSQCYTGVVWAGYEISTFTFLLDATEPSERAQVSSYLNILSSFFGLIGGLTGAALFVGAPLSLNPYFAVFGLSAGLRLVALFTFGNRLQEVRIVAPIRARDLLVKATGFKSATGMTSRLVIMQKFKTRKKKAG